MASSCGRESSATTRRRLLGQAAIALALSLVVGACWGEESQPESRSSTGAARLHRLELTSEIPSRVRAACESTRKRVTVRVICPDLIPDVPLFTPGVGLHGPISFEPTYYLLSFNSGDPPGPARHWMVGGGLARAVEKWVLTDIANEIEGNPKIVGLREIGAQEVLIYRFPPFPAGGPNGGHWAAFVRVGRDEMVFASLHGKRYIDAAVEMALSLAKEAEDRE